jgi:hypothetical protein
MISYWEISRTGRGRHDQRPVPSELAAGQGYGESSNGTPRRHQKVSSYEVRVKQKGTGNG